MYSSLETNDEGIIKRLDMGTKDRLEVDSILMTSLRACKSHVFIRGIVCFIASAF